MLWSSLLLLVGLNMIEIHDIYPIFVLSAGQIFWLL